MKNQESLIPKEWFDKAEEDLKVTELLFKNTVSPEIAVYHLQQTIEKYRDICYQKVGN